MRSQRVRQDSVTKVNSLGKNTGVGCHYLLQGIFFTQGCNSGFLNCRQILYHLRHQESPSKKITKHMITLATLIDSWGGIYDVSFPDSSASKESTCNAGPQFDPWVGKIPWRRDRLSTPVFWPEEFRGLCSPWNQKESDMTEQLSL